MRPVKNLGVIAVAFALSSSASAQLPPPQNDDGPATTYVEHAPGVSDDTLAEIGAPQRKIILEKKDASGAIAKRITETYYPRQKIRADMLETHEKKGALERTSTWSNALPFSYAEAFDGGEVKRTLTYSSFNPKLDTEPYKVTRPEYLVHLSPSLFMQKEWVEVSPAGMTTRRYVRNAAGKLLKVFDHTQKGRPIR